VERSDTIGLSVAAAAHVLLLAALSFGLFKAPKAPVIHQKSIDVSLVDAVALESATRSPGKPATAQAPETGPVEEAAPAPVPEPEPEPKPVVKPAPPPPPPPAPKPEPKAKPEVKPSPKPVPKPVEKPKPVVNKPTPVKAPPPPPKNVAAAAPVTKKAAPEKPAVKPSTSTSKSQTSAKPAPAAATKETSKSAAGEGSADKARASRLGPNFLKGIADDTPAPAAKAAASAAPLGAAEARALNAEITRQLKPYWRAPTGADVDQLVTVLTWRLNRDGTIASGPTVVSQTGKTDSNRPQQQLHIEAAIRAVKSAAPYNLPPQYYDNWKFIEEFRFDKRL
jgi:outer membrane biosynthesis protein TonB